MNTEACAYIVSLIDTNCLWAWNQIHLAETPEALEQVRIDIGSDVFENESYTKNERAMDYLRAAWLERQKAIEKPRSGD